MSVMGRSLNVLIVDDSRIMRRMVGRALALTGVDLCDVHEASDGRQALAVLRASAIDLVLADVNMPVMTGFEMVEHMAADSALSKVPVVVVSTERSEPRMQRMRELGVRAYVHKPFTPEQFRAAITDALGARP